MKAEELRALQAPVKAKYRDNPASAVATLTTFGAPEPSPIVTSKASCVAGSRPSCVDSHSSDAGEKGTEKSPTGIRAATISAWTRRSGAGAREPTSRCSRRWAT